MQRLTDAQWHDAFRAGNYADADAARYIARHQGEDCRWSRPCARPIDQATR